MTPTFQQVCAAFDAACIADDGGLTSNLAFNLAEKAGWRWEDDEQFCQWALGATERECAIEGKRRFLIRKVARLFSGYVMVHLGDDWHKVANGDAHPNDLCDANHFLIEAFAAVYGREPFFPSDVELGHSTEEMMNRDCDTLNAVWDASFALWREAGGLTSTLNA